MIIAFTIILAFSLGVAIFMQTPKFGKRPSGERLERIKQSPNYKDGQFQNLSPTPMLSEGASYGSIIKRMITSKIKEPQSALPTLKTNLKDLDPTENVTVWMGHSSYFMQLNGKTILVDPVLSGSASPVRFTTKAFEGSDAYTTDDIPEIDYLFITHDHWDHLDYKTVTELKPKIKKVICGLGNGAHFERWGFDSSVILEEDWNTKLALDDGFTAHVLPTRHFSGRGFKRNQALWASFALITPSTKIYIGGDGGYDTHFEEIGNTFGPFDIVFLENGQYDQDWKYIHTLPDDVVKVAEDLNAKTLLPVHSGKFTLGNHDWDEPLSKITQDSTNNPVRIITPMIGEQVNISDTTQQFTRWWEKVD